MPGFQLIINKYVFTQKQTNDTQSVSYKHNNTKDTISVIEPIVSESLARSLFNFHFAFHSVLQFLH